MAPSSTLTLQRVLETVHKALVRVEDEIARHQTGNGAIGSVEQLEQCRHGLGAIKKNLEAGTLPPKAERSSGIGKMVADSWPLDSHLGGLLLRAEQQYIRL